MLYIQGVSNLPGFKNISIYFKKNIFNIFIFNKHYWIVLPYKFKDFDYFNKNSIHIKNYKLIYKINYIYLFILKCNRISFKGKGYRVRIFRKKKKITFNFGHSHWTKLKTYSTWDFFKFRRQRYLFAGCHNKLYLIFSNKLSKIRTMNRYTLRGLRMKKQAIKQRFGKISQYISSLH